MFDIGGEYTNNFLITTKKGVWTMYKVITIYIIC